MPGSSSWGKIRTNRRNEPQMNRIDADKKEKKDWNSA
jgi:hypothetical protein